MLDAWDGTTVTLPVAPASPGTLGGFAGRHEAEQIAAVDDALRPVTGPDRVP